MNDFIQLPRSALTDDLWRNPNLARLYLYLIINSADGQCAVSIQEVARLLNLSRTSTRTAVNRLIELGLIRRTSATAISSFELIGVSEEHEGASKLSKIKIFEHPTYREIEDSLIGDGSSSENGYVYAIEFWRYVKIGCTICPANRFLHLKKQLHNEKVLQAGRMAISPPCLNYKALECYAHIEYELVRLQGTELFVADFDDVVKTFENMPYKFRNE